MKKANISLGFTIAVLCLVQGALFFQQNELIVILPFQGRHEILYDSLRVVH
jgi:hypothetical protein